MYNLANVASHNAGRDTYILDIHRTSAGLAAISSNQLLTLHDPAQLAQGPLRSLKTDHGNLTTLRVFDGDAALVCTAGENGMVGVWDLRQGTGVAQFKGELGWV